MSRSAAVPAVDPADRLGLGVRLRRPRRSWPWGVAVLSACVLVVLGLIGGVFAPPRLTAAQTASLRALAQLPPMGFNDWNAFGCDVSEELIERTADAMMADGMAAAGYTYVNIDDCWMAPTRSADGALQADPVKFPDGIAAVAAYVHARGLELGIYEDAGTSTCAGYPGSYGHEEQDAATFAAWDVDYVKYDQCNIPFADFSSLSHAQVDQALYTRFAAALESTGRSIVFSACSGGDPASFPQTWAPAVSNLWRTTGDIADTFASMVANVQINAGLAGVAGPSRYNDPDMLEIGNGGQTDTEYRAQFSIWAVMAAPLLAGTSLTTASAATLAIYENKAVIAVDQDPLGVQGTLLSDTGGLLTWVKPLADGDVAVVLFNSGTTTATMAVTSGQLGLSGSVRVTDLWSGAARVLTGGTLTATVAGHAAVMWRVHRL